MSFGFTRSTTESANYYSKQNSTELPNGPSDSVSQLAWSRDGQALACASWDRTCRVWQITTQPAAFGSSGQSVYKGNPQSLFTETAPILSCCFGDTTQMLLTAGCDKQVKAYDLISGRTTGQVIGQHDSPVNFVAWNPMYKLVISTSWDGAVKMWDGKQPNPVWQQNVGAKICKAAFHDCFLGICDTFHDCLILNVPLLFQQNQIAFPVTTPSAAAAASIPVFTKAGSQYQKMQTRSIAFFPDDASQSPGAAIGSVEGRCSIVYIKEEHKDLMALSSAGTKIRGRKVHQTLPACFLSMSFLDGRLRVIFSLDAFYRLKTFEPAGAPIADLKYDPTSTALAYAVSYDWNKGPDQQEMAKGHHVYIHAMKEEDLRPRPKNTQRR
ncbi:poly(A)+ RNA export protein, putative [Eimeria tenella]|uniref:Poly(A)+ RNA export protein, putative n=1 Tax=Eimeria tenella TaxID=5802 RepID=U6KIY2_EIMTE|nr:poly(A)+ RNA export protein, putative [Eimeria tenella]CDJ37985.1 poly(A)+ RNA export protein, putative [Eimeria tenella]|eukprot:XP_013228823.1 poly(A)+ RNA export protein, putative [Eimeria tenella]